MFVQMQTSNTMLWLMYRLANNPEVQDRVFEEVNQVLGQDGYVTDKELNKIPYLKSCLKESVR